jgi:hypothetical protein
MICGNKECAKDFDAKTHNQKYCSDECCRVATNRRIMEKYYEKKAIRNGAFRYNQSTICSACEKKINVSNKNKLIGMIDDVS